MVSERKSRCTIRDPGPDDYRNRLNDVESLVLPEADSATEAGRLISQLPKLWSAANLEERRKLMLTMLDAVRRLQGEHDRRDQTEGAVQAGVRGRDNQRRLGGGLSPRPRRQASDTKSASAHVHRVEADSCSWWRRGRVELAPSIFLEAGLYPLMVRQPLTSPRLSQGNRDGLPTVGTALTSQYDTDTLRSN
jgi:hypothetical protein